MSGSRRFSLTGAVGLLILEGMKRVTTDDLLGAADWLDYFDAEPGNEEGGEAMKRVAEWLRNEAARREETNAIRAGARKAGVPAAALRAVIRRRRAAL